MGHAYTAETYSRDMEVRRLIGEGASCRELAHRFGVSEGTVRNAITGRARLQHPEDRFWSQVEKIPFHTCWEWAGTRQTLASGEQDGYGKLTWMTQRWHAHRLAWTLTNGEIPDGLWVLHRCDNRGCVRPDHLFLGTRADNIADMVAKGRAVKPPRRQSLALSGESCPFCYSPIDEEGFCVNEACR